jgi:hypothetical protein
MKTAIFIFTLILSAQVHSQSVIHIDCRSSYTTQYGNALNIVGTINLTEEDSGYYSRGFLKFEIPYARYFKTLRVSGHLTTIYPTMPESPLSGDLNIEGSSVVLDGLFYKVRYTEGSDTGPRGYMTVTHNFNNYTCYLEV